jgi:hypothetical protein
VNDKTQVKMCPLTSQGREQHLCFTRCAWWIDGVNECAMAVIARNMVISTRMMDEDLFAGEFDEIDEEAPF